MRDAFISQLVTLSEVRHNTVLLVGDLGYSVVEPFAERYPDRFFNLGVAEQNMAGVAAGLASEGYHVFIYSIANFPTLRCAEQIRNDIDYHNHTVTVVTVGGGLSYGSLGYSHHAIQDYGLMRSMPNMLIASPGDPLEVRACVDHLIHHPQPSYLRLRKAGEPTFHTSIPNLSEGVWQTIHQGIHPEKVILTTGATLSLAMEMIKSHPYDDFSVCTLPLWGLRQKTHQAQQVIKYKQIITLEDHLLDCGFGSWLIESVVGHSDLLTRITPIALSSDVCGAVGSESYLLHLGQLVQH